jgi:outer membrane receptor protein involved in Fe transport
VEVLDEPIYADTFSGHVGGFLISRRLEASVDGFYSNGQLTYTLNQNAMVTYSGSARLEWGLSPHWSMHSSYGYYAYSFGRDVPLPIGMLPETKRHSIRVGVSYWVSLMRARGGGDGGR